MGLNIHMLKMLFKQISMDKCKGLNICELGNLYVAEDVHPFLISHGIPLCHTAKELFNHFGFNDISIDLNGKDGALPLDLGKPIKKFRGKFDVLINGGTTEHVDNQYICWKNIHNLCKENALVVSVVPLNGNMINHKSWRYSLKFFNDLADVNKYKVLQSRIISLNPEKLDMNCVYFSFRRNSGKFIRKRRFVKIWNENNDIKALDEW